MSDPYHHDPSGRTRAYSGANAGHPSYGRFNYDNLARTESFNQGDDADYFDGGTGVGRRQSIQQQQYPDEYYYEQTPSQATSYGMGDRTESPRQVYGTTPQGNGNGQYQPQYSSSYSTPAYDIPQDTTTAPYPTSTPAYNGGPQPYNPAAYPPQRHATSAGTASYSPQADYRPQRHATTTGYTGSYNPSNYTSSPSAAPYPTSQSYVSGSRPLPMPGASMRPQPSQSQYTGSYGTYSNNRPQYANAPTYMSPTQTGPYSPGLPPVPSQSAPAQAPYQPPPPPPPPVPPASPGYNHTSYGSPTTYAIANVANEPPGNALPFRNG
jgi:hypothetical protein